MIQNPPANINHLWADLMIENLCRAGVECFCISPGSRSTPLAWAVARRKGLEKVVHFDERGTAFYAVGYTRATGRPAVWITTSGTAVANGLPAIIEASQERLPMILLTGDRPPELRDTGANQAIDQVNIFGKYVRWFFDIPCPTEAIELPFVLSTVAQALDRSLRAPAGPVHLNCMYREPLAPSVEQVSSAYIDSISTWLNVAWPFGLNLPPVKSILPQYQELLGPVLNKVQRGVVVVGGASRRRRARGCFATGEKFEVAGAGRHDIWHSARIEKANSCDTLLRSSARR